MYTQEDKEGFFNAVESLKKYRRADLIDDKGNNLLEELYVDLLPSEHILKKSLKDNTTYLVGRKWTGKSTIFLRIEQELRKNKKYLPCYIDVKTVYESAQTEYLNLDYLNEYLDSKSLQKYLIERSFLQNVLSQVIKEINLRYDTFFGGLLNKVIKTKSQKVKAKIEVMQKKIEDNEILRAIEIPAVKNINFKSENSNSYDAQDSVEGLWVEVEGNFSESGVGWAIKLKDNSFNKVDKSSSSSIESSFSSVYLQVFQIKSFIQDMKDILQDLDVKHIVILLDDFSEIDDNAIEVFVDVLLAPLNNWSEDFIKFKIAAYPNRIHYGKIDPGKVDTINLDFYNLYSEFSRDKMEEWAIDFTRRILEKRILYFTSRDVSYFFDTTKSTIEEFYELIFQTSMNVPRIIGYILSFCYQSTIIYNKKISRSDIESASQKYYDDKIAPFFYKTTYALMSMNEKIDILQLRDLLSKFTDRLTEIKRKISTSEYSGESYIPSNPFSSHFYFMVQFEKFITTLELNYFISKYTEQSDKDWQLVSIYCINYGLAVKNNLPWWKPQKNRKYFIERPFNFNSLIKDFLASTKKTYCTNISCNQSFTHEQTHLLEFSGYRCNKCGGKVVSESIADDIQTELKALDSDILLSQTEIDIIFELARQNKSLIAREIAEELDISSQSVAWKSRFLDQKKGLIKRSKIRSLYSYELTELAKDKYL